MSDTEDFIKRVKTDAYNATIARMWSDAWAMGYEAAKKDLSDAAGEGPVTADHPLYPALIKLDEKGYSDLRRRAYDEITGEKARAERELLDALATLGRTIA